MEGRCLLWVIRDGSPRPHDSKASKADEERADAAFSPVGEWVCGGAAFHSPRPRDKGGRTSPLVSTSASLQASTFAVADATPAGAHCEPAERAARAVRALRPSRSRNDAYQKTLLKRRIANLTKSIIYEVALTVANNSWYLIRHMR